VKRHSRSQRPCATLGTAELARVVGGLLPTQVSVPDISFNITRPESKDGDGAKAST
jgi:hypothetical protein